MTFQLPTLPNNPPRDARNRLTDGLTHGLIAWLTQMTGRPDCRHARATTRAYLRQSPAPETVSPQPVCPPRCQLIQQVSRSRYCHPLQPVIKSRSAHPSIQLECPPLIRPLSFSIRHAVQNQPEHPVSHLATSSLSQNTVNQSGGGGMVSVSAW